MEYQNVVEQLTEFGLTRQEASIYLCLYQNGELNGYETAKYTGISRSNVYSTLAGLVEKGAAYLIEGASSKYTAVPVQEFCVNKIRNLQELAEKLEKNVPKAKVTTDGYITIEGYRHIYDKVLHMLESAQYRIYLSAPHTFIEKLREILCEVIDRRKKLVLITDAQTDLAERGAVTYLTDCKETQLRLIIDSAYVLTGEITGSNGDTCLFSGQTNFVNVFKEALHNEIKLIELTGKKAE